MRRPRRGRHRGCCTSRAARSWSAPGSRPRRVALRAEPVDPARSRSPPPAIERLRAAPAPAELELGDRADALRARRRRRPHRVLPPLPPRPAARAADPPPALAAPAAPALALGGARLGGRQAADRDRRARPRSSAASSAAGGRGSGRAARRLCATSPAPAVIAGRAPAELESMDLAAGRAVALRAVAREVAAGRCDPAEPGRRRAAAGDPRDRPLDRAVPGALRPRRTRLAARRRPRATSSWSAAWPARAAGRRSRRSRSSTRRTRRSAGLRASGRCVL